MWIVRTIIFVIGYLLGSANSAILVGKVVKNVDIRTLGSGNAGATNTLRTLGKGPAVMVVIGDALKGVFAVLIGWWLGGEVGGLIGGFSAVLGHNWPIYFKFKGGKGILTSAIVILMVTPKIGLVVVIFSIIVIAVTRYVSLGSIAGAVLFPIMVLVIENGKIELALFALMLGILAIIRHHANIKRLFAGTESKLGAKGKQGSQTLEKE